MKKDTASVLRHTKHFQVALIGVGILVGLVAGLVVLAYRICLEYAGTWLAAVLAYARENPWRMAGWFLCLGILAFVVGKLVKWEPMISGSGIPQLEGEMTGKLNPCWWKVLIAKFAGGFLSLLGGLSLGREGPSIQLGAMVGKGISRTLKRSKTEEKFLLTCGASAGLAAAFHAPLAGVMFSLEEVHKNFSVSVLLSVMASALTADYLCTRIMGVDTVFQFQIILQLPTGYYWMLLLLGIILGFCGAFYNWFTLKVQSVYNRVKPLGTVGRLLVPFMLAGVLGFTAPDLLGSGHDLIERITGQTMLLGTILLILVLKFLFSAVSFGSGAPGGIFFPLLVLGGFIGGAFGTVLVDYFGLSHMYVNNFVLLAMAGFFTAIVRAPLTGIILIFEMTGSVNQMLSLSVVSIVAYIVATLLGSKPIYESLLSRLLLKQGITGWEEPGERILSYFAVMHGSGLEDHRIDEIDWPDKCLLVSIQRGGNELIPHGRTVLSAGDIIITISAQEDQAVIYDQMEELCRESMAGGKET